MKALRQRLLSDITLAAGYADLLQADRGGRLSPAQLESLAGLERALVNAAAQVLEITECSDPPQGVRATAPAPQPPDAARP